MRRCGVLGGLELRRTREAGRRPPCGSPSPAAFAGQNFQEARVPPSLKPRRTGRARRPESLSQKSEIGVPKRHRVPVDDVREAFNSPGPLPTCALSGSGSRGTSRPYADANSGCSLSWKSVSVLTMVVSST